MNFSLLFKLMDTNGVSGSESSVARLIQKEITPFVDKVYLDKMGNLIAVKTGKKPRVLLAAHLDEVGLLVKRIDDTGLLFLAEVGNLDPASLVNQRVEVMGKVNVPGVISTKKISNDWFEEKEKPVFFRDLFVDTGLAKKELAKKGVVIGSPIAFKQANGFLGSEKFIYGKALDDRIGCFMLIELIKRLKKSPNELVFVFTVQEEIGMYGAKTSTYHLEPDWSIVVDAVNSNDIQNENPTKVLGSGPALTIMDFDMMGNRTVNSWLQETAKKNHLPLQPEVSSSGSSDALNIAFSKSGVPTSMLGIVVRNLHTSVGVCHADDIENGVRLLQALLKKKHVL